MSFGCSHCCHNENTFSYKYLHHRSKFDINSTKTEVIMSNNYMFSCMKGGLYKTMSLVSIAFILTISEKVTGKIMKKHHVAISCRFCTLGPKLETLIVYFCWKGSSQHHSGLFHSPNVVFSMSPEQLERQNCCKLRDLFLYRA